MFHRENIKKHNTAKIIAETFGHYNIFATLSLSQALAYIRETVSPIILRAGRPRQYTAFLATAQGRPHCFLYPDGNRKVFNNINYSQLKTKLL